MNTQQQRSRYYIYYICAMVGLLGFLFGAVYGKMIDANEGVASKPTLTNAQGETIDSKLLWEAWNTVKENYVDQPVDDAKILEGAIRGVVDSFDDPHTIYFSKADNEEFLQELSGSFFGIGAEIAVKQKQLQVVAPLPDSPAERSGLRAGDYILKINDEESYGMLIDEAVSKIRGEKGTEVKLTIYRASDENAEPKELIIIRDEIKIQSVIYKQLENNIALIELRYFNADTDREFKKAAQKIIDNGDKHIILDMRNNPGGFLDVAITISSMFIEDGVIVSEKMSDGSVTEHKAQGRAILADIPVTVLINEGSASASEIVAGALKDYEKGKLVGKKSYGKGSVQTLFDLSDGSAIKLTIAKWLTPKGSTIDKEGIMPDIEVELTTEDFNANKDPQLDAAVKIANEQITHPTPKASEGENK